MFEALSVVLCWALLVLCSHKLQALLFLHKKWNQNEGFMDSVRVSVYVWRCFSLIIALVNTSSTRRGHRYHHQQHIISVWQPDSTTFNNKSSQQLSQNKSPHEIYSDSRKHSCKSFSQMSTCRLFISIYQFHNKKRH